MVLSLVQVVLEKTESLRLLEEVYEVQAGGEGRTALLDSLVEAACRKGFCGSLELAAGVLRRSGRFLVERRSAGRWVAIRQSANCVGRIVRRSNALVPVIADRRSTALVPVTHYQPFGSGFYSENVGRR